MAERRPVELLSLITGLLALTGAGLYLLDDSGAVQVDAAATVALLCVVLGVVGLVRSVLRFVSSRRSAG
ncbi:MAG: hypothetical protein JWM02_815 [Frankiales bacterium]|nr:hypothetical protein [Frankiales bacterium]